MKVNKRKYADPLLKVTKFHKIPVKKYPHKLFLCTIEEIKTELRNQRVTDIKKSIHKKGEHDRN